MAGYPQNPMQPYGGPVMHQQPSPDAWVQAVAAAEARGRHVLESTRANAANEPKLGVALGNYTSGVVGLVLLALLCGLLAAVGFSNGAKGMTAGLISAGIAAASLGGIFALVPLARATTPKRAIINYFKLLGRGKTNEARKLVALADLDDMPRFQPRIANLGQPCGHPLPFGYASGYGRYWNELLRSHSMPYCLVGVSKVRVTPLAPDVAVVDFHLALAMNTQLWIFLILVAWLVAIIVDSATRKNVKAPMRKVLVRVGEEWHLLNGEWQGFEESNPVWALPQGRPA
ncbi:MAG: hypothetical protein IT462_08755 [Planctomycetes bacterium]|nr:hypothetical protein [Planctomycetota bacterium]